MRGLGVIVIQLQRRRYVSWTYLMVQAVSLALRWRAAAPIYIASKDQQSANVNKTLSEFEMVFS